MNALKIYERKLVREILHNKRFSQNMSENEKSKAIANLYGSEFEKIPPHVQEEINNYLIDRALGKLPQGVVVHKDESIRLAEKRARERIEEILRK